VSFTSTQKRLKLLAASAYPNGSSTILPLVFSSLSLSSGSILLNGCPCTFLGKFLTLPVNFDSRFFLRRDEDETSATRGGNDPETGGSSPKSVQMEQEAHSLLLGVEQKHHNISTYSLEMAIMVHSVIIGMFLSFWRFQQSTTKRLFDFLTVWFLTSY
jgi:hypothetical protein